MFILPQNEQGQAVVALLAIGACVLEWVGRRAKQNDEKKDKEAEVDKEKNKPEEMEVISKTDFDILLTKLNNLQISISEDVLGCVTIINILLLVMSENKDLSIIKRAEKDVYNFIRHAEFPSRQMVVSMFETMIQRIESTETQKEATVIVDTGRSK